MKTVYKVVRLIDGQYVSCVVHAEPYGIVYKVGEFVKPFIGRILAFDSLFSARQFYNRETLFGRQDKIFRAVAGTAVPLSTVAPGYQPQVVAAFWKAYDEMPNASLLDLLALPAPTGTLACTSLKLLEVVYE